MKYENQHRYKLREDDDILYEEKGLLRQRRVSILKIIGISVGFIIAILLLYFAARLLFRVESISVDGNLYYTSEEIIEHIGIETGDFQFSYSCSKIEEKLSKELPYIEMATVVRHYPSGVSVSITEHEVRFILNQKNKYIAVSDELKVLEVADENKWQDRATLLELPTVSRAIEGNKLEFLDVTKTEYISGFLKSLKEFNEDVKIDKIILSDYFNIKMLCDQKYSITIGKYDSIEVKLHTLNKVMESETVSGSVAASIDMSDPKEPRVIPYDRADAIK
ncbi:MAG: FtsQ-type POTRA domain-containing protein [Clostridia bacterium]|nr:FtsQ-type POTRA domain-containing protein [Clostridia bacterium]